MRLGASRTGSTTVKRELYRSETWFPFAVLQTGEVQRVETLHSLGGTPFPCSVVQFVSLKGEQLGADYY